VYDLKVSPFAASRTSASEFDLDAEPVEAPSAPLFALLIAVFYGIFDL